MMILGLSHIAFGCNDVALATTRLADFGYSQRFDEPHLDNNPAKRRFLNCYNSQHHIRSLAADGAMAIELLDHGTLTGPQNSSLIPVFRSDSPCSDWQNREPRDLPISNFGFSGLQQALGGRLTPYFDPVLSMTLLWAPASGEPAGLRTCICPTVDQPATEQLLRELRFRPGQSGVWSLLTPLPALSARLITAPFQASAGWTKEPLLDAPGCACLALMARESEPSRLPVALKAEHTCFTLTVNNRRCGITLTRPEQGPIIELIEQLQ
jgi:hypothetical protein